MNESSPKSSNIIQFASKAQIEAGDLRKKAIDSILAKEAAHKNFWDKLEMNEDDEK
jgi:hypothetical protein